MRAKVSPTLVHVYAQDRHYQLVATETRAHSYFGGPHEMQIGGKACGPAAMHHFVLLSPTDIPLLREHHLHLPLLFGMQFDGCRLKYHLKSFREIVILDIAPKKSSKDWPYPEYPRYLPYVQLEVRESRRCTWRKFSDPLPNAPNQMPCDVFVAVPPPTNIGMSLWGPTGNDSVHVVWEFYAESKIVRAYSIC
jgi:hypothetical protein